MHFLTEMVVIQGVLLTVLVLVSICWAFCCKKKCFGVNYFILVNSYHFTWLACKMPSNQNLI